MNGEDYIPSIGMPESQRRRLAIAAPASRDTKSSGTFPCNKTKSESDCRAKLKRAPKSIAVVFVGAILSVAHCSRRNRSIFPRYSPIKPPTKHMPNVFFIEDSLHLSQWQMKRKLYGRSINDTQAWKWRRKYAPKDTKDANSNKKEKCKYRHSWQKAIPHTCLSLHEINMQFDDDLTLLNNGHYRDVFSYSQSFDGSKMVMKELRFEYDHRMDNTTLLERHRIDAVAMGQLSNSDNIPNIYASCANAQIVDVSPDGDLEQHILIGAEHYKNYTSIQKLAIAVQVAEAIADVHENGMAHTDIKPKQFLLFDGRYRLTDFNRCQFLKEDDDGKQCLFHIDKNSGKGRSPEEYRNDALSPKIDVYSMGNLFYYMLMGFKYFDGYKAKSAQFIVEKGGRPHLSQEIKHSQDPAIDHIVTGMRLSQAPEPDDRPSAREIAGFLAEALRLVAGNNCVEL